MKSSGFILGAMMLLAMVAFASPVLAGSKLDPPGPPSPEGTMKTLDEIPGSWHRILSASERFVVVMNNEAVLDKETGLVWQRSPDTTPYDWQGAQINCFGRSDGDRFGWGLPTMEELSSLVALLPAGHPFTNIQPSAYWSATTLAQGDTQAWTMDGTTKGWHAKTEMHYVWCVRGGRGYYGR
jgi:uncharacterized protein DUF1566